MHTSTVTVAVVDPGESVTTDIPERDLKIEWYSGTGAGGQRRNKVQSSCRITHIPTGVICSSQTRSRENSYKSALSELTDRVNKANSATQHQAHRTIKRKQVGSGMRGDKIRTIRLTDDRATDHRNDKRCKASAYMKGHMDELWD